MFTFSDGQTLIVLITLENILSPNASVSVNRATLLEEIQSELRAALNKILTAHFIQLTRHGIKFILALQ